jgi:hypothetical protein
VTTLGPVGTAGTYEFQVTDLLHDPLFNKWSQSQIDYYINIARKQLCMDTGCLRSLQPFILTGGVEQYTFGTVTGAIITAGGSNYTAPTVSFSGGGGSGVAATLSVSGGAVSAISFTSFGSGYTSAPIANISDATGTGAAITVGATNINTYDILQINAIWGTEKYAIQWYPFRQFSAWLRPFIPSAYQRQPAAWAVYGDNTFFIGPVPDQSYQMELDSIILPTPFATADTTTVDAIPVRDQDPIQFYAAYLARKNVQDYGAAQMFMDDYTRRMREVVGAVTGRIHDIYQE